MLHRDRHHDNRELRTLTLMDSYGVCQCQLIKFRLLIFHRFAIECHCQSLLIDVYTAYKADIAIKHALVVIIADLHHLVTLTVDVARTAETRAYWIQSLLEQYVEV